MATLVCGEYLYAFVGILNRLKSRKSCHVGVGV